MKPILALRHVPHEGLGVLEPIFRETGLVYSYVDVWRDMPRVFHPRQLSGLVVLGGPMNVDQTDQYPFLATEVAWIREAIADELPVLGICLGSQLLAKALGARVYANGLKEIGWYELQMTQQGASDQLFSACLRSFTVFQWHGDTFDLPPGAVHLACSPNCEHQAFRYGPSAYGLQFHLEVTAAMIEEWLTVPGGCAELATLDYIDPAEIRRRVPQELPPMHQLGREVLGSFAELCRARAEAD